MIATMLTPAQQAEAANDCLIDFAAFTEIDEDKAGKDRRFSTAFLVSLLHWCDEAGLVFADLVDDAEAQFLREVDGEEGTGG